MTRFVGDAEVKKTSLREYKKGKLKVCLFGVLEEASFVASAAMKKMYLFCLADIVVNVGPIELNKKGLRQGCKRGCALWDREESLNVVDVAAKKKGKMQDIVIHAVTLQKESADLEINKILSLLKGNVKRLIFDAKQILCLNLRKWFDLLHLGALKKEFWLKSPA